MKTRVLILVFIVLTAIVFPRISNKKSFSTEMITTQGGSFVAYHGSGTPGCGYIDVGFHEAESIYSQENKFDFYNATYRFDKFDFEHKFIDGVWHDEMISATVNLELIIPLNLTGYNNSCLLYFFGNWGGGNSRWGEILIVYLENNTLKTLQNISSGIGNIAPKIENNHLIITEYDYLGTDPLCCPSLEVVSTLVWDGNQFILDSQKRGLR